MAFIVGSNKIEYEENGKILAEVCYPAGDDGAVDICHTYVDGALRGRGMAAQLLERAAEEIRKTDRKAVATCSYAVKWFSEHPEQRDILNA